MIGEAEKAAAAEPMPETPVDALERGRRRRRHADAKRERRRQRRKRGRMAVPDSDLDRLLAVLGPRLDELRSLLDEVTARWRGDAVRVGEGRSAHQELARELGLITREDWDELDLRVAQLEHRLRLVEERDSAPADHQPDQLLPWAVRRAMAAFQ